MCVCKCFHVAILPYWKSKEPNWTKSPKKSEEKEKLPRNRATCYVDPNTKTRKTPISVMHSTTHNDAKNHPSKGLQHGNVATLP